ncbi:FKBP-type peptidyl-prolyl cis-trans isomerase [Spirosoma montaniterrae]|uniref:Peptidyl-prolyl cis-trans isomerase n=1 Tax=Spirosoma montaniterrae TaxID=1178516 RepID=A0A1P9X2K0_9BACT|nr:FKBP-type peptidyl-prolyl cis-trans isomerase [Spirosoma montaniterrae]AQG81864.1 peptidylprolyl isomerase [Spirosoma montaniterrae]
MIVTPSRFFWAYSLLAVSALLASCQEQGEALIDRKRRENEADIQAYITANNISATNLENGIYFFPTKTVPNAQAPATGDEVRYHYIARRLDGVIVDSTDIAGNVPASVILAENATTGITLGKYAAILKLKEGEEGSVLVPAFADGGRVGTLLLPQYSPVRYDMRIVSVRTENEQIRDYIRTNNLTVTTTTSDSVRVIKTLVQPTDSAAITTGKNVTINYTGYRLDGSTFDSNNTGSFRVTIGTTNSIQGLQSGLLQMRAGEKGTIIFPSKVGYGATGTGRGAQRILPYTPLRFDIQVVKVQ